MASEHLRLPQNVRVSGSLFLVAEDGTWAAHGEALTAPTECQLISCARIVLELDGTWRRVGDPAKASRASARPAAGAGSFQDIAETIYGRGTPR